MFRVESVAIGSLVFSLLACRGPMGMMGQGGSMSGREMMGMMREAGVMEEWMEQMYDDPPMMARMMGQMQQQMRQRGMQGGGVYCPMMGYTPENPPAPEPDYEPGTLSATELYTRKCSRCHALPDPGQHTAAEWADTVARMADYIDSVRFISLSPDERDSILGYLRDNARPD